MPLEKKKKISLACVIFQPCHIFLAIIYTRGIPLLESFRGNFNDLVEVQCLAQGHFDNICGCWWIYAWLQGHPSLLLALGHPATCPHALTLVSSLPETHHHHSIVHAQNHLCSSYFLCTSPLLSTGLSSEPKTCLSQPATPPPPPSLPLFSPPPLLSLRLLALLSPSLSSSPATNSKVS